MIQIDLSEEEKELLKQHFKTAPLSIIRLKAQALIMRDHGLTLEEIASFIFREVRSIDRWIKDFSERRMGSIFSGLVGNENAAKLTRGQKEEIKRIRMQNYQSMDYQKHFGTCLKFETAVLLFF